MEELAELIERSHTGQRATERLLAEADERLKELIGSGIVHDDGEAALPRYRVATFYESAILGPAVKFPFEQFDLRRAGDWREEDQTVTRTVCSYCGVGCNLELHVQDNTIVKVTSPLDHSVTEGHLCIKGRFGFQHVQNRSERG